MLGRKIFSSVALFALLFFVAIVTADFWLPLPGKALLVNDELKKADAIVVLLGDDMYFRFRQAAELYKKGYAPRIIVSVISEPDDEEKESYFYKYRVLGVKEMTRQQYITRAFQVLGVNPAHLEFTESPATATYEEAVLSHKHMMAKGYRSFILVTATYHMKRSLTLFRYVFRGSGVEINHVTAHNDLYDPEHWWRRERDVKKVALEYLSFIQNFIYRIVLKKEHTDFDDA